MDQLEQELAEIDQKKLEFEELITEESQSQGRNLQLEDNQVRIILQCSFWLYEVDMLFSFMNICFPATAFILM